MDQNSNNSWLEPVLTEHLGPVNAPGELWGRIQTARKPARRRYPWGYAWVAAAAMFVVGVGSILHARAAAREMQSSSGPEIQAWVKKNTGLDIPFPARFASSVQLMGSRRVGSGVEIAYAVASRPERILISRSADSEGTAHRFMERGPKVFSWTMGGQSYSVECATPEDVQAACMLCHSGGGIL